ncbi:MAG: AMIN domain-containing protein [Gemmatimonadetes bacterium]|nr:AMIN domain-containing protein [Gemmatimonadota bacterium]
MMSHAWWLSWMVWATADPAAVTELRVTPLSNLTEIVILASGEVRTSDFLLTDPARLIVDIQGAEHALPAETFEGIQRGGVLRVRTSQFRDDVVRIVVDLSAPTSYTVTREPGFIRVIFPNPTGLTFEPWSSNGGRPGAELRRAPPERAAAPAQEQRVQSQMRRVSLVFENTDIQDVLATFAEFSGRSIVPGLGVSGTVNADIRNQPWDVALDAILTAQGLSAREEPPGIIRVDQFEKLQERQKVEPLVTQIFKVNYVPVEGLATAVAPVLTERGKAVPSKETSSLIVTDVRERIEQIQALVRDLDVRTPQVTIQARIVFVDRTEIEELGIVYDLKDIDGNALNSLIPGPDPRTPGTPVDTDFDGVPDAIQVAQTGADVVTFRGKSVAALANARDRIAGPALQILTSAALGEFRLFNFIEALQRMDLSDVQAVPTIQTMDNQPANILVGERTPIRVLDPGATVVAAAGAQAAQAPRATVRFEETGIKLNVTPHITPGRQIVIDLLAERSGIAVAPADIGFIFQTQRGQTRLTVDDGQTAVIGGLTISEVTRSKSGVPILMDLPVVGALFRTTRSRENKRDLLILVTPHITGEAAPRG